MAIDSEVRRSDIYTCDGVRTQFSFAFKVFASTQVDVRISIGGVETSLDKAQYICTLNSSQDTNPGGTVTTNTAPEKGASLVIVSAIPYKQPQVFTNRGNFYPEQLNTALDRLTALSQQLLEKTDRAIVVDPTDTMTPSDLKQKLLDAAESATVVAKGYAEAAQASAEAAAGSAQDAAESAATVDAKGEEQKNRVTEEGDKQVKRLQDEADNELILTGTACGERTWTLQADVAVGAAITIPDNLIYLVGRHHLRVSWNGLVLYPSENFNEIGDLDTRSKTFSLTFPVKKGDVIGVWVGTLGEGDISNRYINLEDEEV